MRFHTVAIGVPAFLFFFVGNGLASETTGGLQLDSLEKAYWACDSKAAEDILAERRMDEGVMQTCGAISRELQRVKFDDDFGKLHQWTLLNRDSMIAGQRDAIASRSAAAWR